MTIDLDTTQEMARSGFLDSAPRFKTAERTEINRICNGCGAAGAKFDFVPDTIYGLYVGHACHIHDWDYEFGFTHEDKEEADRRMRNNLLRIIERAARDKWQYRLLKPLMRRRAQTYYDMVCMFGGPAFWASKNSL